VIRTSPVSQFRRDCWVWGPQGAGVVWACGHADQALLALHRSKHFISLFSGRGTPRVHFGLGCLSCEREGSAAYQSSFLPLKVGPWRPPLWKLSELPPELVWFVYDAVSRAFAFRIVLMCLCANWRVQGVQAMGDTREAAAKKKGHVGLGDRNASHRWADAEGGAPPSVWKMKRLYKNISDAAFFFTACRDNIPWSALCREYAPILPSLQLTNFRARTLRSPRVPTCLFAVLQIWKFIVEETSGWSYRVGSNVSRFEIHKSISSRDKMQA